MDDFDEPLGKTKGVAKRPGEFARDGEDGQGSPWISDPDGALVKSGPRKGLPKRIKYGRPSNFGKDIENTYNLQRWSERQIIFGLVADPTGTDLTERLVALADLDPESDAGKSAADGVIAIAKDKAKANLAAARGTHIHTVTEFDDTDRDWITRLEHGEQLGLPAQVQAAMSAAWSTMLGRYGLEILATELPVVHDGWRQAGTLDRIARLTRHIEFDNGVTLPAGAVIVLDVKTGKLRLTPGGRVQYWHSYSIQLVAYADAVPYDVDAEVRLERTHDINPDWAIIAHLPVDEALQGKATCRLVLVDLQAARTVVEGVVMPAKEWQARSDVFAMVAAHEPQVVIDIEVDDPPAVEEPEVDPFDGLPTATANGTRTVRHDFGIADRAPVNDEGGRCTDEQVKLVRDRGAELAPQAKASLDALVRAAKAAGRGFSIGTPTMRRWHIYRALIRLGLHFGDGLEDVHVRATLALVLPEVAQLGVELGPAIGSLTTDEAAAFVRAAIAVLAADPALTITDIDARWLNVSLSAA